MRSFALGLAALGFKRGDKLSVLGDNRARLYWAQVAAQALGGISVPLYQDSIASELAYVLRHAEVSVVVAEDQEQVDKVLSLESELPNLRLVVYEDPRGMSGYAHSILKSFAVLEETPGVPGLDLPGLGIAALARGWGCHAVDVETTEELEHEFKTALGADTTTVIVVRTQPQKAML